MDLESSVREHSASLTSVRATDRKKSAEAIKDLLTRNALASVLTKNALKKRGFTWNELFDDINDYILKETEKYETSKTFYNVTAPLATSLLHMCVAGSNKGRAYIKCDRIIDACLNILKDGRLTKAIGDAYLNLLYKHVLTYDHYLGYITPTNWEELLNVCMSVCLSNNSKLDNFTKLRLLLLIIKNGKKYCQFVISLRDSLSKLKKCFLQVQNDKKVQEVVVEIVISLLEMLSAECRLTMCEFTENILTMILKFYDNSLEQKKKSSLFKLLEMTISIHHPGGKLPNEDGSLSNDKDIWDKHVNSILEIVSLEINYLQKMRKPDDYCIPPTFFSLAAAVYFQIFNSESNSEVLPEEGTSSKRQKVGFNKYKTFADLLHQLQTSHLPWLGIVRMYTKFYIKTISTADSLILLKCIEILLSSNHQNLDWDGINDIIDVTLSNCKCLTTSESEEFEDIFLSIWNSCVRNSTSASKTHKHLHTAIHLLLMNKTLKYEYVQPLKKLYLEKSMPVNNNSVRTLNILLHRFFNKCSQLKERLAFFDWFIRGNASSVGNLTSEEFFQRLITNENIKYEYPKEVQSCDSLFELLFKNVDQSILFSEFEFELLSDTSADNMKNTVKPENHEINSDTNTVIQDHLENKIYEETEQFNSTSIDQDQYLQGINTVLAYLNVLFKSKFLTKNQITELRLYHLTETSLRILLTSLTDSLKSNQSIPDKIKVLQHIKQLFLYDYDPVICDAIRNLINEDFFHCINNLMNKVDVSEEDDIVYEGDESEMNATTLKYNCIYTLAAYCRVRANFRDELLDLILDRKLYNFTSIWDVNCAFKAIDIINYSDMIDPPLEPVFVFMQYLCKDLFRNPDATLGLLKMFLKMLKRLWSHDRDMKENCYILVRGYLERCERMFYPPNVAAFIYKCAAEIISLNASEMCDIDEHFVKALIKKSKGNIHGLRLYCCYLLKTLSNHSVIDAENYLSGLSDIFVINVSERKQSILKDESINRTSTVLHSYSALALARKSMLQTVAMTALQASKDKSLDTQMVKKVLNTIATAVANKTIDVYLNTHILSVLNFWFIKKYDVEELPLQLFGVDSQAALLEKHMNWLVATDILWRHEGNIKASNILKQAKEKLKMSESQIIEVCFCNITVLCLPYIVAEKYKLRYTNAESPAQFKQSTTNATRLFQMTRQILENEKWSNLFVENIGELLLLTATHLNDHADASERFGVKVPKQSDTFLYPKEVFSAILQYFGELTDGDIMQYLCEDQPVAIFKILLRLWDNVLQEEVLEIKALSLHAFVVFTENIPLVSQSEAFICNYVCNCFAYAIKKSKSKDEIRVLTLGLKMILERLLPAKIDLLRKALACVMSILIIKKEEGYENECASLLDYLVVDMRDYMKEGEDVVDYFKSMSQRIDQNENCFSVTEFSERLKTFKSALMCPSYETLCNLQRFLKTNKHYVNNLCKNFNTKGFSEDCGTSMIHQIIYHLNNILKSVADSKTIIEACNCLAVIGTYDLKTLVTVPPPNTKKIVQAEPKQHFAQAVVAALAEFLFDENPAVTNKITKTLHCLFKFREGVHSIESDEVDQTIIKPFTSDHDVTTAVFKIDETKFQIVGGKDFMVPSGSEIHGQWLTKLTIYILNIFASDSNFVNPLKEVCLLKPEVCQKILPSLFGLLLSCSAEKHIQIVGEQINRFFNHIWDISFDERLENSGDSSSSSRHSDLNQDHKLIIQYMLDVVNMVRLQKSKYRSRPSRLETLNYLKLDYDKVAWAATMADQNLAAIYYGELWAAAGADLPPSSPEATSALQGGKDLQRIFRKSFVSLGELDAIDGCGTAHLTIEDEKRKHLINTGQYLDALLLHDIALSAAQGDAALQYGAVRSLHKSGMHHLALRYSQALPETDQLNDVKYECLSFLGDWSEFVDTRELEEKSREPNCNTQSILKAFRYACLKDCLNIQMKPGCENKLEQPLNRAKLAISRLCQKLNMENCQNFYKVLSKLHLFNDIEDYFDVRCNKLPVYDLIHKWRVDNLPVFHDFKYLEDLISQRNLILEHSAKTFDDSSKEIVSLQMQYAELSLSNRRIQMAQRLLAVVKNLQKSDEVVLLESQISWAKGHQDIALSLLRDIVSKPIDFQSPDLRQTAISLRQYGLWMAESKSDNPRDIINKYLKKSLDVLKRSDDEKTKFKIYYDIAKFADAEYKQVLAYMNSPIFENKVKVYENMKDTATTLKSTQQADLTRDERKALLTNDRFQQLEEAEILTTRSEKESFLQLAMRYYLLSLKECEENNLSVFRVISLWLDNPQLVLDSEGGSFEELLHAVPSRKFIAVLPQLAPRLTEEKTTFASNLRKIIGRCAKEHPHHTLPILFSLKNSDKDKMIIGGGESARAQEPRVAAAASLLRRLAAADAQLGVIVAQMEKLCDATISFANYKPKLKEQRQKIPPGEKLQNLFHLDAIPIPTVTVPIRSDCNYNDLCTVVAFDNYFELVGGINCPKKLNCKGSDGSKKILLIKGEDDLRQDAVMQQVFNIVNTLLEKNSITSRNKLNIRTYKVVPMSRQSGVLEWCVGTTPIGAYLVGPANSGAHARYRPQDISCAVARAMLNKCHEQRKSPREKLAVFLNVLKQFRPVFHYFFTEHYLDPVTWYERRLAYTKSVATSSMVGYILGLGDRHVQNILIDTNTAEVVHIDFGIAFDQGKALPTPETIPFRLTQDIIAGFGSSGVEGIFRRSCEKTMQLLRDNQETLLTLLEVLLWDPLYSWTVVPNAHATGSRDTSVCGSSNSGLAERALLAVSSKLSGTEGGVAGGVAVAGQVARLIQTATDPANLCRLFPGWQPYL
ncbi:serine-protein kinase ATM isoform X1 [Ostrinia nubilalis]|uniref:serine-protein kinase ATM isoform X1 n=2 Tax=Ostrinia nubilalis TaxID=29057 RepID=UPI0030826895